MLRSDQRSRERPGQPGTCFILPQPAGTTATNCRAAAEDERTGSLHLSNPDSAQGSDLTRSGHVRTLATPAGCPGGPRPVSFEERILDRRTAGRRRASRRRLAWSRQVGRLATPLRSTVLRVRNGGGALPAAGASAAFGRTTTRGFSFTSPPGPRVTSVLRITRSCCGQLAAADRNSPCTASAHRSSLQRAADRSRKIRSRRSAGLRPRRAGWAGRGRPGARSERGVESVLPFTGLFC